MDLEGALIFQETLAFLFLFFFNDTASTEIYTLSLHDALPIFGAGPLDRPSRLRVVGLPRGATAAEDRKSTRLNSSHQIISYAVFCLKKKNTNLLLDWSVDS